MEKVYIFGHRNPDTDSVTAAITLSYLKNKLGMNTIPAVLSSINLESKFALNYFNVPEPIFLNDVNIKLRDLKYTKNYTVKEKDSIYEAYFRMNKVGISKIPVVDKDKNMIGILSMKDIAKDQFAFNYSYVDATYDNICEVIKGTEILRFDDDIEGELLVASYKSTTFMEEITLNKNNILIVGDRHSIIEYAVNSGVKLIVVIGNGKMKEEHLKIAKKNKVNIIYTSYNTLETTKIFNLCNNVTSILNTEKILCVNENDDVNDFIKLANKTRYSYYPVLNKRGKCNGIIRFSDVGFRNKKNVILVDHNSYEQSAIGLEEANILEIIDHHNIGTVGTNMPISFRNMPVGSTNTIIYKLYKENRIAIPKSMAGLMLSGILLGPWWTMMIAGLADLIGALLFPFGAYFVGYTITSILTGFVYGLFLHRKDEKLNNKKFVLKLIISCLIVLIVCNGLINSLWIYITSKKAIMAILPTRLLKQIVMLPIEVVIMFFINLGLDKMGIYKKLFSSYDDIDDTDDVEESNDNTDNQYIENNDNRRKWI